MRSHVVAGVSVTFYVVNEKKPDSPSMHVIGTAGAGIALADLVTLCEAVCGRVQGKLPTSQERSVYNFVKPLLTHSRAPCGGRLARPYYKLQRAYDFFNQELFGEGFHSASSRFSANAAQWGVSRFRGVRDQSSARSSDSNTLVGYWAQLNHSLRDHSSVN